MPREGDMKVDSRVDSILINGKGVYRNPSQDHPVQKSQSFIYLTFVRAFFSVGNV